MAKTIAELVNKINNEARKSFNNYISSDTEVQGRVALTTLGYMAEDADLEAACCLYGSIYEACLEAGLENFEAVRSGLALAFEAIVRPQGRSAVEAWRTILSIVAGQLPDDPLPLPVAEKRVSRALIKKARQKRLADEGRPEIKVVSGFGRKYTIACRGGHLRVEYYA